MPASNHHRKSTDADSVLARQEDFLQAFARCGTIRQAASIVGVHRTTVNEWRKDDFFQDRFQLAKVDFREHLEEVAFDRLKEQGANANPVLLITLLNAHYPEKYRPNNTSPDEESRQRLLDLKKMVADSRRAADAAQEEEEIPETPEMRLEKILKGRS